MVGATWSFHGCYLRACWACLVFKGVFRACFDVSRSHALQKGACCTTLVATTDAHRSVNLKCSGIDRRCTVCHIGARIENRDSMHSDQMRTLPMIGSQRPLKARPHAQLRSQQSGHWDSRSSIGWQTQCQTNAIYVHTCADDTLLSPAVSQESTAVSQGHLTGSGTGSRLTKVSESARVKPKIRTPS